MMTSSPKAISWKMLAVPAGLVLMVLSCFAAPPSSINEDLVGSRIYYRNRDNEDNMIPKLGLEQQQIPVLFDPQVLNAQQPSENALLNYLLSRRLGMNRLRSYVDSSNDISRKRSYSKFCAWNAISCFG